MGVHVIRRKHLGNPAPEPSDHIIFTSCDHTSKLILKLCGQIISPCMAALRAAFSTGLLCRRTQRGFLRITCTPFNQVYLELYDKIAIY